jgi:NhaP-type Na+/H+ or K+/H+ antiporter
LPASTHHNFANTVLQPQSCRNHHLWRYLVAPQTTLNAFMNKAGLGYLAGRMTAAVDDPQIEITLTTILAHGSYLVAYQLHLSGVIATASAGLMLGTFSSKNSMSARTRTAM